jgi:hypothetical protein
MCNCEANKLKIEAIYSAADDGILKYQIYMSCECGNKHNYEILYSRKVPENGSGPNVVGRKYRCYP